MGGSRETRREFVRRSAGLLTAGALGGAITGVAPTALTGCSRSPGPAKRRLFETAIDVTALATDGDSLVTASGGFDGVPILVVRTSAHGFVALSMQCTHEGCPVKPPVGGVITCPCHGSQYDLEGKVRSGPAQFPLARYETTYDGRTKRLTVAIDE